MNSGVSMKFQDASLLSEHSLAVLCHKPQKDSPYQTVEFLSLPDMAVTRTQMFETVEVEMSAVRIFASSNMILLVSTKAPDHHFNRQQDSVLTLHDASEMRELVQVKVTGQIIQALLARDGSWFALARETNSFPARYMVEVFSSVSGSRLFFLDDMREMTGLECSLDSKLLFIPCTKQYTCRIHAVSVELGRVIATAESKIFRCLKRDGVVCTDSSALILWDPVKGCFVFSSCFFGLLISISP